MNKQSKNKVTKTVDKSRRPSTAPTELGEQELGKASGGAFDTYMVMHKAGGTVADGTDPNTGGKAVNPFTGKPS